MVVNVLPMKTDHNAHVYHPILVNIVKLKIDLVHVIQIRVVHMVNVFQPMKDTNVSVNMVERVFSVNKR